MSEIFFIADTHFQHRKFLEFKDSNDKPIRTFDSVNHMDEFMINKWNSVVNHEDTVYHLGDVAWKTNARTKEIIHSLRGKKRLCLGNHDDHEFLAPFFERIYLWKYFEDFDFIASHVPLNELDMKRTSSNVHGHMHEKSISMYNPDTKLHEWDLRYLNVCVEQIDYTPLHLEEVLLLLDEAAPGD